ncbi:MAG TPA: YciI family protein [Candidatus Saccharimonadales bacterium]|nr:YciI family protein [Candidatus Saccharimonadales bacterium]
MTKYIFVYKSKNDWTTLPREQVIKMMEAWGEWLGSMGSAVVDSGQAFKAGGKQVTRTGIAPTDDLLSGYTIVEADDFDTALALAQGSPTLTDGGTVEVYEAFGL